MQMVSQQRILAEPEFRGFVARPDDRRTVDLEQARRPRRQVAWPVVKVDDVVIVHRSQVPFEIAPEDSDALEPAEVAHRDPGTRLSTLRRGDEDLQTLLDNLSHPVASFNRAAQQCDGMTLSQESGCQGSDLPLRTPLEKQGLNNEDPHGIRSPSPVRTRPTDGGDRTKANVVGPRQSHGTPPADRRKAPIRPERTAARTLK